MFNKAAQDTLDDGIEAVRNARLHAQLPGVQPTRGRADVTIGLILENALRAGSSKRASDATEE